MRIGWLTTLTTLWMASLAGDVSGATILAQVSPLGGGTFKYTYSITTSPFVIQANDVIDITFDPTVYGILSNPIALPSSDWTASVDQPNVPFVGLNGDYFVLANVNNPSLVGPFTVDFTLQSGKQPGPQPFAILDANFNPIEGESGQTIILGGGVPEPASFSLAVVGVLIGVVLWKARRRAGGVA
jgi:hypothetical protein